MHHIPSSGASSAGVMVQAVMERQEIEKKRKKKGKKKKTEQIFKALGSLRKRPRNAWRGEGNKGGKENKGISELSQGEKVSGEAVRS